MFGVLDLVATLTVVGAFGTVSGNVSQCYHCNSLYCGDSYDVRLGAIASCSDVFKNAKLYSSRIVASTVKSEDPQVASDDTETDIETLSSPDATEVIRERTHAQFFDIQRKIWEFFNKGEIDETTQFVCVKANYNYENGQTKTYRGCVPKYTKSISTACDFVSQKVISDSTSTLYSCHTCESNLCNSAMNLTTSVLALIVAMTLKIIVN